MASRSKPDRRPEGGSDSMEAIKPLIVLVLFGTILYGAYSVVQKGPSREAGDHAQATEAPPFAPPAVDIPAAAAAAEAAPAAVAGGEPPAAPQAAPPPGPPPPVEAPAAIPPAASVAVLASPPPAAAETAAATPTPPDPAAAAAGLATAAAAATADALAGPPAAPAEATAAPPAPASAAPPTYLAAESAPPPAQDDVPAATGDDRPERLALASQGQLPASLPPEMPPPGALPSSAAFAGAWTDAHEKLTAGRYAEALTALSVWYDDPSLGLEESHRLEDLLGQLAGTVIYSQQDLLLPPHVVAPGETLPAIAGPLGVPWQLLAKINGVADPLQLIPGEHLKLVRGPFDAVVSVARRRLSLQVGGAYAGSFAVVVGRDFLPRVGGTLSVTEVRRALAPGQPPTSPVILLADGLMIQAADDPTMVADDAAPTSLVVSARDFAELIDILGPGSSVLIRQ